MVNYWDKYTEMHGQQNDKYTEMHGQQNDKYTEMHGQQNDKYTEMHGQQNFKIWYICPFFFWCSQHVMESSTTAPFNINLFAFHYNVKVSIF